MGRLLEVTDLRVSFYTYAGKVHAVRGVSFWLDRGETLAIVGESGCGKTVTASSVMKLIPSPPGKIEGGSIVFDGREITSLSEGEMQHVRGKEIGMIFQDPMTALNPTMTIGRQITEALIKHQHMSPSDARERAIETLEMVEIPNPAERLKHYPHQFSGGMRQRVMIAMALSCNPKLLIADEPTTGLDVTIQAQILDLMKNIQTRLGTAIILITHDLGVVAKLACRVMVMYAGKVVESGASDDIYYDPQHPYTRALLQSVPKMHGERKGDLMAIPGTPPDLFSPPKGCAFAPRCNEVRRICLEEEPEPSLPQDHHSVACWLSHPMAKAAVSYVQARGGAR